MIDRTALESGNEPTYTATRRSRIPSDLAYIQAFGRAFHNFSYLEWTVVIIILKLTNRRYSCLAKGMTAGYLVRKLTEAINASSPALSQELRESLTDFHRSFVKAKRQRDKLVDAHPYTTNQSLQQLANGHHEWPTEKLNKAAAQFEAAAICGSQIVDGELARALADMGRDQPLPQRLAPN